MDGLKGVEERMKKLTPETNAGNCLDGHCRPTKRADSAAALGVGEKWQCSPSLQRRQNSVCPSKSARPGSADRLRWQFRASRRYIVGFLQSSF
jgi:hypothetical protein